MRADAHSSAPFKPEHGSTSLGDPAKISTSLPAVVENYWGAAFHWIAFGCSRNMASIRRTTRNSPTICATLGEPIVADQWDRLEHAGQGAMTPSNYTP